MSTTETPVHLHSSRNIGLPPPLSQVCTVKERVTRNYSDRQYVPHKFVLNHRVTNFISYMEVQSIPDLIPSLCLGPMKVCEHKLLSIPISIWLDAASSP